ncbi:vancomycin high temperature exclusion protein [Aggregicoccus sp. 17bor-14]|uniref:SanA/YdcF family protein n=1 Tax=Myxococcaceae TaxID=31 RepID=UPI003519F293
MKGRERAGVAGRVARGLVRALVRVLLLCVVLSLGASLYVSLRYRGRILPAARAPEAPVALVFGAGLAAVREPSPVLAERLDKAVELYRSGKVKRLLVSGDNSDRRHDETRAMVAYVRARGVPEADVEADFAGLSTYDSCVRAHRVFEVRRALLVTQAFHLPRALFIANSIGVEAWGVAADEGRQGTRRYALRELVSRPLALAMVLLHAEPAFPTGRTPPPQRR